MVKFCIIIHNMIVEEHGGTLSASGRDGAGRPHHPTIIADSDADARSVVSDDVDDDVAGSIDEFLHEQENDQEEEGDRPLGGQQADMEAQALALHMQVLAAKMAQSARRMFNNASFVALREALVRNICG